MLYLSFISLCCDSQARGEKSLWNQSVDKKQRPKGQKSKNLTRGSRGLPTQEREGHFQRQDWMDACSDQKEKKVLLDNANWVELCVHNQRLVWVGRSPRNGSLDKSCGLLGAGWQVRRESNFFSIFDIISLKHLSQSDLRAPSDLDSSVTLRSWLYP